MSLATELENASDAEIEEAGNQVAKAFIKKIALGVVASVAVHFLTEGLVHVIETRRENKRELTQ